MERIGRKKEKEKKEERVKLGKDRGTKKSKNNKRKK